MAVDKQEIGKLLGEYFRLFGRVSISNTGLVSITGYVEMIKECDKLPVSFDRVGGHFKCIKKGLKTLVGAPRWVGGSFYCNHNQLEKLEGAPRRVGGDFYCWINQLKNLEGAPLWVGDNFVCINNPLESLKGLPSRIGGTLYFSYNKKLPLCEILTSQIKDITIDSEPTELTSIVMKYRNTGYSGILPFAAELVQAGYGDNAWL
jgi:hypothetical protein